MTRAITRPTAADLCLVQNFETAVEIAIQITTPYARLYDVLTSYLQYYIIIAVVTRGFPAAIAVVCFRVLHDIICTLCC